MLVDVISEARTFHGCDVSAMDGHLLRLGQMVLKGDSSGTEMRLLIHLACSTSYKAKNGALSPQCKYVGTNYGPQCKACSGETA